MYGDWAAKLRARTGTLTDLLRRMRQGDRAAEQKAYEQAYQELRAIARKLVRREYGEHVGATELVNETYLRHLRRGTAVVKDRQHFYSIAARAMRNVLIDLARERKAARRGGSELAGGAVTMPIDVAEEMAALGSTPEEMLALDAHLERLQQLDPRAARVFELRFFLGHTAAEAAALLAISEAAVRNDWEHAKAWLRAAIDQDLSQSTRRAAK
ncbi:MAG: sigma-70 family RNA polymerase sigma factor [Bryobacterales bacterium]|nr:sigma-70 family RNA polymerase sigma factor [Bryobacterales bacterium]